MKHTHSKANERYIAYIVTTDHKVAILHGIGEHAALGRAAHGVQSRLEFLILSSNVVQEHAVLRSNKQMRLLPSHSYREAGNGLIRVLQHFYSVFPLPGQITSESWNFKCDVLARK